MTSFSQGTLEYLNKEYYVYALVDPRTDNIFYIGKGKNDRVFQHELDNSGLDTEKLNIITELKSTGLEVKKYILQCNLSEDEAFAAESALINCLNLNNSLSNIVAGHGALHEAYSVERLEKEFGAEVIEEDYITDDVLCIKINKLYNGTDTTADVYEKVRGYWKISKHRLPSIKYVVALYNGLSVGVYEVDKWFKGTNLSKAPRIDTYTDLKEYMKLEAKRMYFTGKDISATSKYMNKSFSKLLSKHDQTPIRYFLNSKISKVEKVK